MPPDPARQADTTAWLRKADLDVRAAEVDLEAEPPLLDDAAFHSQQAVEKALKAFLTWYDEPFRRPHDLNELGPQVARLEPRLEPLLRRAAPLTEFAWAYRYPGGSPDLSEAEVRETLAVARSVVDVVRGRLAGS